MGGARRSHATPTRARWAAGREPFCVAALFCRVRSVLYLASLEKLGICFVVFPKSILTIDHFEKITKIFYSKLFC